MVVNCYCNDNSLPLYIVVFIFDVATSLVKKSLVVCAFDIVYFLCVQKKYLASEMGILSFREVAIDTYLECGIAYLLLILNSHLRAVLSFTSHKLL